VNNAGVAGAGEHLVVVVAHPDDETFGCGSTIASAAANGARVTVVCATRGEAGERLADPSTDHLTLGELRERELRSSAAVLGVESIELLDHADSGWDGPFPPGALCTVPVADLADEIGARLTRLAPDVVLIVDGGDGHRDHRHIRDAVELARSRPVQRWRLVRMCLANSLMRRWVDEMRRLRSGGPYVDIDPDALGTPDAQLTPIDVSPYLAVREQAIACHRSQRSPFEDLSPTLRRAFLGTDYVQEVAPIEPAG
jgi:LmbE family N-acetylglucosaminyl deacetylase